MIPSAEQKLEEKIENLEMNKENTKTLNYTNGGHKGVLVKFDITKEEFNGNGYFALNIWGNAFTSGPFHLNLSFNVASSTDSGFNNASQKNLAGNFEECSVLEMDGKIAVWIPHIRTYSVFAIESIFFKNESLNGINKHTVESLAEKPSSTKELVFTIR